MLTDAEMQRLLDAREKHGNWLFSYRLDPARSEWIAYVLALDAALPKLVEEVLRLRIDVVDDRLDSLALCGAALPAVETDAEKLSYYEREMT